jgi:deoxyuridine 5'-triphosphate nucleotidohydrolase
MIEKMSYGSYVLKLFPVSEEARNMYTEYLGGTEKLYPDNANAGFDLITTEKTMYNNSGSIRLINLGVRAVMVNTFTNKSVHFWLAPRSSIWKNGVTMANSMGVIDRTYRGQLMAACTNITATINHTIDSRVRLVQILAPDMGHISKVVICDDSELDNTERGAGGFGSTG